MKVAASSRTVVVALALAGSVGIGAGLAASAATAAPDQSVMRPASTVGQRANATPEPTVTSTAGTVAVARDPHVGLVEASRIAALVAHGRVTEADQETTGAGLSYEMTVVGPNGAVRTVTVDAATGRVLANTLKDTTDAGGATESADGTDADGGGDDHVNDHGTDRDVKDDDSNDRQATGHEDSSVG
jgi:uncharacterized membrane protein YkoI